MGKTCICGFEDMVVDYEKKTIRIKIIEINYK